MSQFTTTAASATSGAGITWDQLGDLGRVPIPNRRGISRRLVLVWLERDDEPIPAPWTDCVIRRFFDHATASDGVIIESPDIPWEGRPGERLVQFSSWEELDIEVRRITLQRVADTLPNLSAPRDDAQAHVRQGSVLTSYNLHQAYGSSPLAANATDVIIFQ